VPAPVSLDRAKELFDMCNRRVCCAASATAPCIPFVYPDDGCWARANEMCRLMIADGADPEKVWIFGGLNAQTQNNPSCAVQWGWHVAPTLQVLGANGAASTYVIDPSLFTEPVSEATWKSVQGDPFAVLATSPASTYWRDQSGTSTTTDPTYSQTAIDLDTYRLQLRLRSAGNDGPPPYFTCMVKPPGTQWFGTIPGYGVQRWFTYGWSATSHVLWTIMPLTSCPGGPQLTWWVQVERASAAQATHWITVRNVTPDILRFEGRYDVLRW
jgi:hypothetical protein